MNARNSNQQKYSNAAEQAGRVIGEFISIADDFSKRFESELSAKGRSCRSANTNDGSRNGTRDDSGDGSGNDAKAYKKTSDSASYSNTGKDYRNKGFGDGRDASGFDKADLESENHDAGEYAGENPGEYLRELSEAAIYALDGFAKAKYRYGAARKIKSGEAVREKLSGDWSDDDWPDGWPEDWLDQMSALLKQNDPMEFFERLRGIFERGADENARDNTRDNTRDNSNYNAGDDGYSTDTVSDESSVIAKSGVDSSGVAHQRRQKLHNIFSDEQLEELNDSQFEELLSFVEINFKSALQLVRNK